jgi:hypothetical protein
MRGMVERVWVGRLGLWRFIGWFVALLSSGPIMAAFLPILEEISIRLPFTWRTGKPVTGFP